jgi:outer membrane protein assembly factor BamB
MRSFRSVWLLMVALFIVSSLVISGPAQAPGTILWKIHSGGQFFFSSAAVGSDGTIYVGSWNGQLLALDPSGTQKWAFKTNGPIFSSPTVGPDGTIYVGSLDQKVYAIKPDGTLQWSFATRDGVYSSPALSTDGKIYIGSRDNNLYALNPNGTLAWQFTAGAEIESSPAVAADGTIYVGSWDGNLYALNPDGTLKWQYAAKTRSSPRRLSALMELSMSALTMASSMRSSPMARSYGSTKS